MSEYSDVSLHTEVIRAVADWMAEGYYFDEMVQFAYTCKTAYETLEEEVDWVKECDAEDKETYAMESEDFDVGQKKYVPNFKRWRSAEPWEESSESDQTTDESSVSSEM